MVSRTNSKPKRVLVTPAGYWVARTAAMSDPVSPAALSAKENCRTAKLLNVPSDTRVPASRENFWDSAKLNGRK